MTKITKATLKRFIRINEGKLYVNTLSEFDGRVDGCEPNHEGFKKVEEVNVRKYTTFGSKVFYYDYNKNGFHGIEVSTCCGRYVIAIKD